MSAFDRIVRWLRTEFADDTAPVSGVDTDTGIVWRRTPKGTIEAQIPVTPPPSFSLTLEQAIQDAVRYGICGPGAPPISVADALEMAHVTNGTTTVCTDCRETCSAASPCRCCQRSP